MKAIVLNSGGLDSTVCFRLAVDTHTPCLSLFFDYGQVAAPREWAAAEEVAVRLGVPIQKIDLPWLKPLCRSPLVDPSAPWPDLTLHDLAGVSEAARESARAAWIPNRNAVFIQIAAAFAESMGAGEIVVGFNAEEAATFSDNSQPFVDAVNESLKLSTQSDVRVVTPTGGLTKAEIVRQGKEANAPLDLIWSCYRAERKMCWRCESCLRLRRALETEELWEWFKTLSYQHGELPTDPPSNLSGDAPHVAP